MLSVWTPHLASHGLHTPKGKVTHKMTRFMILELPTLGVLKHVETCDNHKATQKTNLTALGHFERHFHQKS